LLETGKRKQRHEYHWSDYNARRVQVRIRYLEEVSERRLSDHPSADGKQPIPAGWIHTIVADIYPDNLLAAYLEGQFVNLQSGTVYSAYDRIACRSSETVNDGELLNIGMDFNVTNMSAVVYVSRGTVWHAVDEFKGIYDTPNMIRIIKEKYPESFDQNLP
jgi:hypothetical protein